MNGFGVSESVIFNIHDQEMGVYIYILKHQEDHEMIKNMMY